MGSPDFAVASLRAVLDAPKDKEYQVVAVVTQPDKKSGRGQRLIPTPVKELAQSLHIPVLQPQKINTPESVAQIRSFCPDLLVVVAFGQLLKQEILDIAPLGVINVHASLLPFYRGAAPIHRAIMNGEGASGVTTMYIDLGMDSGDMIFKKKVAIDPDENTGSLHDKLAKAGGELLLQTLNAIAQGNAPREAQNHQMATYAPLLSKDDEIIDWNNFAQNLHNQIRGMNPLPGVYTYCNGKRLKIHKVKLTDGPVNGEEAGTVSKVDQEGICVNTGRGVLCLVSVQPEGKSKMTAAEFARGYRIVRGSRLG